MISFLSGKIILIQENFILVDVGGVGFKVFVYSNFGQVGDGVSIFTFLNVREDALMLFGFATHEELMMFEILTSVSGVGPKLGMTILANLDIKTIKTAIVYDKPDLFLGVSGVGKKISQRMVLELKNKFSEQDLLVDVDLLDNQVTLDRDAEEALVSLGYNPKEVRSVLSSLTDSVLEDKIRAALKILGK